MCTNAMPTSRREASRSARTACLSCAARSRTLTDAICNICTAFWARANSGARTQWTGCCTRLCALLLDRMSLEGSAPPAKRSKGAGGSSAHGSASRLLRACVWAGACTRVAYGVSDWEVLTTASRRDSAPVVRRGGRAAAGVPGLGRGAAAKASERESDRVDSPGRGVRALSPPPPPALDRRARRDAASLASSRARPRMHALVRTPAQTQAQNAHTSCPAESTRRCAPCPRRWNTTRRSPAPSPAPSPSCLCARTRPAGSISGRATPRDLAPRVGKVPVPECLQVEHEAAALERDGKLSEAVACLRGLKEYMSSGDASKVCSPPVRAESSPCRRLARGPCG